MEGERVAETPIASEQFLVGGHSTGARAVLPTTPADAKSARRNPKVDRVQSVLPGLSVHAKPGKSIGFGGPRRAVSPRRLGILAARNTPRRRAAMRPRTIRTEPSWPAEKNRAGGARKSEGGRNGGGGSKASELSTL